MNSRTFDDGLHELSIALTERVYLKNPLEGGGGGRKNIYFSSRKEINCLVSFPQFNFLMAFRSAKGVKR